MPEPPLAKFKPAWHRREPLAAPPDTPAFAELLTLSNFTFLRGASHPEELVQQAAALGYRAIAISDVNTLAGVVRAHSAARECGIQLVVGARLHLWADEQPSEPTEMEPTLEVAVYPMDRAAYGRLCRLLTLGKRRAEKGNCHLTPHDLWAHHEGLQAVVMPPTTIDETWLGWLEGMKQVFDQDRLSLALSFQYQQHDRARLDQQRALSDRWAIPLLATNDALYHSPDRQPLQDMVTCIRHGCTIDEAGFRLWPNAQRHLKPREELARLFSEAPQAVSRSMTVARRCAGFTLDQLQYEYPHELVPPGQSPMQHLKALTEAGQHWRYPDGTPERVQRQIDHELSLIEELGYPHYFLTVHDLMQFAEARGILCQGRGAAANSAVCYCLGITAVDPDRIDVLFERFVSKERGEPPDIDVDFEHERREEVIQYLYDKYGRRRAALTAEVITYRARSAVREIGKALGLSLDAVDALGRQVEFYGRRSIDPQAFRACGFDPDDRVMQRLAELASALLGFPRHLSQHVGGFVLTDTPLDELVPIENAAMADRTVIEWDKDDIEALGFLKVDVLSLGMLTCIRKCFEWVQAIDGRSLTLTNVFQQQPVDDPRVYDMIDRADTVGVFQIESRAQMQMLPRLKPRCYYDLVIEVAIVRPGPIQGDMVHPYLRRRDGQEAVTYPDDTARQVLGKTLGVPLFQEQAMNLAIRCAGFTPGEAEQLRRTIQAWRSRDGKILEFGRRIIDGMRQRGYGEDFAHRCFEQIKGFGEYGFPESHAASFALLVYVSAWLKCHYPAAFACALLNSQPMGFYAPAQIVRDAQQHGVEVRPIDVNHSAWDCTLEMDDSMQSDADPALRLGMRQVQGLGQPAAERIHAATQKFGPFQDVAGLWHAAGGSVTALRRLADADAFGSMGLSRQQALWQITRLKDETAPLFATGDAASHDVTEANTVVSDNEAAASDELLPRVSSWQAVLQDYETTGLSLKQHPLAFLRHWLTQQGVTEAAALGDATRWPHGKPVVVGGLVLLRQRPGTASGVVFMSMEDETGMVNLIVRPTVYDRYKAIARNSTLMLAQGRVERRGEVVHVNVQALHGLDRRAAGLTVTARNFQ
jgi:error-prone DNA polymerase